MADRPDTPASGPTVEDYPKRITSLEMDAVISEGGKCVGLLSVGTHEGSFQFELDDKSARALKKTMKRYLKLVTRHQQR